jgi:hypothetical protein
MSVEEFQTTILMKNKIQPTPHSPRHAKKLAASPPIAFDWYDYHFVLFLIYSLLICRRSQGLVTPVKDQEQCGRYVEAHMDVCVVLFVCVFVVLFSVELQFTE